jgi:site-specific DNA recombinase
MIQLTKEREGDCGQCGSRLIVCHAKGRGGTYPYFICIGRQQKRNDCKQRALRIEQVEASVEAYYAKIQLPGDELDRLRAYLSDQLATLSEHGERDRTTYERRLRKLGDEQQKLLAAHYAEAIPLNLLKSEQERITTDIATAEGRLAAAATDFQTAKTNIERALTRIGDCQAAYREASSTMRRQFNLAFFTRLLVDDEDGSISGDLAEPFATLLGDELKNAVIASADREFGEAVDAKLRERNLALSGHAARSLPRGPHAMRSSLAGLRARDNRRNQTASHEDRAQLREVG